MKRHKEVPKHPKACLQYRRRMKTHCLFFSMLVLRSSMSSMGDEEERRELSEGLKEGELLSPCSTDSELGLSSKACTRKKQGKLKRRKWWGRWLQCECAEFSKAAFCLWFLHSEKMYMTTMK